MKLKDIFRKKSFKYPLIAIIILFFLSIVLVNANFNATKSKTSINTSKESFSVSESEIETDLRKRVFLYVEDQSLNGALDKHLQEFLKETSSDVKSFLNLKESFGGPTIAVKILREKIDYTPLYSEGEIDVLFFYSSSGETSYFEKFVREEFGGPNVTVIFESSDGPQKIVRGKLTLRDTSYGITTPGGYKNRLAEQIASRVSNEIKEISL